MKKLLTLILVFASSAFLSAQSFVKGTKVVDLRFELAAYKTESHDKVNNTSDDGGAAGKLFSGSFEYGVFPWLGLGLKMQYSSYFVEKDTITHTPPQQDEIVQPTIGSFDPAVNINFHLGKRDHFDMVAGTTMGVSFFSYKVNDANDSRAKGTGFWYDFHITPRFYFGDHIGMHLNLAYAHFNYPNLIAESSTISAINSFSLSGGGVTFGLGLNIKF